jgi:hypothetical protein
MRRKILFLLRTLFISTSRAILNVYIKKVKGKDIDFKKYLERHPSPDSERERGRG